MLQVVNVLHAWFNVLTFGSERGGWLTGCGGVCVLGLRAKARSSFGLESRRDSRAKNGNKNMSTVERGSYVL